MRACPKPAADSSPLPLRGSRRRELAVARFAADYIRVPRGHGVRKPLRLRPLQRALIARTWDQRPPPPGPPAGGGAQRPLRLRPWQRALIAATWDQRPRPRLAGWMLPRGQGKTSLTAVLALYGLVGGPEGAQVVVVARHRRQGRLW